MEGAGGRDVAVLRQAELRQDLAAKGADLERQTETAARHSAELTLARRKLVDGAAALAEARSAAAVLRGDAEHGGAALRREQGEVARLQAALAAARQETARAKHLRDAQVGPPWTCCTCRGRSSVVARMVGLACGTVAAVGGTARRRLRVMPKRTAAQ